MRKNQHQWIIQLNSEYEFNNIFKCEDWDEFLIVQAPYVNRPLIYIMSGGVLLPEYDYINASEDTYFLLKTIISSIIQLFLGIHILFFLKNSITSTMLELIG
ncbi:hypothetical protein [Aquimarina macrocephali]|uniref:hypothetical protein n=1 Tax=Aquimarina macrocephali TaxID=666563 RepID=UPI0004642D5C|nr:hypothetical protein [Aquimarina macrocephali]